jgi:hypothetical protein
LACAFERTPEIERKEKKEGLLRRKIAATTLLEPMSVAKAVRLGRRRSSRCSPAGATAAATARAHIRYKDAFTSTHDFTNILTNVFGFTI